MLKFIKRLFQRTPANVKHVPSPLPKATSKDVPTLTRVVPSTPPQKSPPALTLLSSTTMTEAAPRPSEHAAPAVGKKAVPLSLHKPPQLIPPRPPRAKTPVQTQPWHSGVAPHLTKPPVKAGDKK